MSSRGFSAVYRSAGTRAKVAMSLIAIAGLVSFGMATQDLTGLNLVRQAELGTLTETEAAAFDLTTQTLAGAYLIAFVASAIAYLAWLSRCVDNVPKLSGVTPNLTPRWAIIWWFIPIANLWKPYTVIRDINRVLATEQRSGGDGLVLAWWITWNVGNVVGSLLFGLQDPQTLDDLNPWFAANLISDVFGMVSAVLAILVIRQLQARANERSIVIGLDREDSGRVVAALPPCPRCGARREAGRRMCGTCGLDLWAAYDSAHPTGVSVNERR